MAFLDSRRDICVVQQVPVTRRLAASFDLLAKPRVVLDRLRQQLDGNLRRLITSAAKPSEACFELGRPTAALSVLRRMGPYSLKTFPPSFLPV
jgi:hypothetical protein